VASILLIAPAAQHRVLFRQHDKESLLQRSSRSAFAGLMVLIVAISAALLLVLDVFFGRWLAWGTSAVIAALLVWWWAAVPLWYRARNVQEELRG
jgi:membrane protein YdbS with pleckstrin-like domain